MNKLASFLTSTALAGFLVALPLAILFLVGMEFYDLLEDTAAFARLKFPFPAFVNALIYIALIVIALFAVCLLIGLAMLTGPGKRFEEFVEKGIAEKIPLLGLVRNLTMNIAGTGNGSLSAVEVDLHGTGTCMLGFLMEKLPDGRCVIFIPSAPSVTLGNVYILSAERVRTIDAAVGAIASAVSQWGVGTNELLQQEDSGRRGDH